MKQITGEEFNELVTRIDVMAKNESYKEALWSRIQEVQSSEPMSVEQIENAIYQKALARGVDKFAKPGTMDFGRWIKDYLIPAIIPLTVQQGFVPDWSKAPEWATSIVMLWSRQDEPWGCGPTEFNRIPRPVPKMRPKTRKEKVQAIRGSGMFLDVDKLKESTLDDLLSVKGISLETEV